MSARSTYSITTSTGVPGFRATPTFMPASLIFLQTTLTSSADST
ncbi:GSCOCG00007327001-RA-CDS [Cotesia congregata]|nr:GSCOCG00007327001-RA-CDS [Cotesia congregata]